MYLTDFRENTLVDVITKLEPDLFKSVTGLTVDDFNLLVSLGVFNAAHMNQAIFAFRRYEDSSLAYTGIESHPDLTSLRALRHGGCQRRRGGVTREPARVQGSTRHRTSRPDHRPAAAP